MLGLDLARHLDPVMLARDCGIEPDPWQAELLRERPKRALLNCCRQSGKSTVTALWALWQACFDPGLVIVVSPSQRQSAELFRSIMHYRTLLDPVPELVAESVLRAEFANGSRILALPGSQKTVRGLAAVRLAIVDEAAQVEDELMSAIRPMLATVDGSLCMLSTPFGRRGTFFEAWHADDQDWTRIRVPADQCPRLSPEFLAEELKALGSLAYSEEYGLEFRDNALAVFSGFMIERAFNHSEVKPLWQ